MTAPQLPEATIRQIAEHSISMESRMLAAELLSARETIERVIKERDSEAREAAGYQKIAKEAADAEKPGLLVLLVNQDGSEVRIFGPDRDAEERFAETVARWWNLVRVTSDCLEAEERTKERDAARAELAALHARIEQSHNGYQETGKSLGMERPASHLIALGELLTEQVELADSETRAALRGIATVLAAAVGAEECPPVTAGNLHAVVDECLARVSTLRAEVERLRDEVTQLEGMERQRDAETERAHALEQEVERVAKQLDELVKAAENAVMILVEYGEEPLELMDAIEAAEQPKPAGGA